MNQRSLLVFFCFSIILFYQCDFNENIEINEEGIVNPDIEVVDSIYITRIDSTGLVYELNSPKMMIYYKDRVTHEEYPDGLDIVFHNKSRNSNSLISANYAYVDENGLTTIRGDVLMQSDQGDRLETSYLLWDQKNGTLETDKLIRLIQTSGDTTYGFGLIANEDFTRFQIKNGYAGKVKFDDLKAKLGLD